MPTQPKLVPVCTNRSEVKITSESSIRAMRKAICHEIFDFMGGGLGKKEKASCVYTGGFLRLDYVQCV